MAKTTREREDDAREERLEHMRQQIAAGELTVRKMTAAERRRWKERSAASDQQATPEDRARRDAALKKRSRNNQDA